MFNEVFDPIEEIAEDINYWLIRTDGGNYYEAFVEEGFVGIGWNYLTLQDLTNLSPEQIKRKIAEYESLTLEDSNDKRKATLIINKIHEFRNLKKGDIVIIPSENSDKLAFGFVNDEAIYTDDSPIQNVFLYKRRKIHWHIEYDTSRLDPTFYKMIHSHHVISNVKGYDKYIDRVIHSVYKKSGFVHVSLEVKTQQDVDVETLIGFVRSVQDLTILINDEFHFSEDVKENSIRLNIQSPGIIEMKLIRGRSLMMLAVVFSFMACGNLDKVKGSAEDKERIQRFLNANDSTLDTIRRGIDSMEIDISRFNNIQ